MSDYPAAPWHLSAHAVVGIGLIRTNLLPPAPAGTVPVSVCGHSIVQLAFFVYAGPGDLSYHEVMATRLVRRGLRPYVNILHIWVDSPASRDGGRQLWAIPKELGDFTIDTGRSYRASAAGAEFVTLRVGRARQLPATLPIGFHIAQQRAGAALLTPVRGSGRLALATARWSITPTGPLGFLATQRRWLTLSLRRLRLTFGS